MATVRRSLPVFEKGLQLLGPRSFHASTIRAKAVRSPAVKKIIQQTSGSRPGVNRVRKTYDPEKCVPPLALLESASKSGTLEIRPHKALSVLRRYQELYEKPSPGWERELCNEFQIKPSTLVQLSMILNRCPEDGQRHLARKVMFSASNLGEQNATFELMAAAIRQGDFGENYSAPLRRLGIMAKKDGIPQAMAMLGQVLLAQRMEKEALEWFSKATEGPTELLNFEAAGEALVHKGRLLQKRGETEAAVEAFRRAASELDDPSAYFYLSTFQEHGSSEQKVYLLKAASSGIVEAWHNLGVIELPQSEKHLKPTGGKGVPKYRIAREWFELAAADGFGMSMLNLALICRSEERLDEGMKWLEKAALIPEAREQALGVKAEWGRDGPSFREWMSKRIYF